NLPSISLFIDVTNSIHYIVLPDQSNTELIFEGPIDIKQLLTISGCDGVISYKELWPFIKANKNLYMNLPPQFRLGSDYSNGHRQWVANHLTRRHCRLMDVRLLLAELRMIKQPYEIASISKAVDITKDSLSKIENIIWEQDQTEESLAWAITAEFAKYGVGHAYPPIVATGATAAILHGTPSPRKSADKPVLFDVGAEVNGYSADISRTYFPKPNDLYNGLVDAQIEIINYLKPGLLLKEVNEFAVQTLSKLARVNGLTDPIEILFPHSIGHHLGLDTHDAANYKTPLQENMVITIEPGLYSQSGGFGMRVEDDVLITKTGSRIL
ncbi:MAG TPA: Xaa-Pro peptidase family protein, partial [Candidatus Obscuribacterales bacterium]